MVFELKVATGELLDGIQGLSDHDVKQPSLLPGWTRAHVLAHLAQNAEGGVRLLNWARTGVRGDEYESLAVRASDIEKGSRRTASELIADVQESADRFAAAVRAMPDDAWGRRIRYTNGTEHPAEIVPASRLTEILFHHVDLDLVHGPPDWPERFVRDRLTKVTASLTTRGLIGDPVRLRATDTGREFDLGPPAATRQWIEGDECWLLAWLFGRSDGRMLSGALPRIPPIF